ncbi:unnamed protein product [Sphagnum compactum]
MAFALKVQMNGSGFGLEVALMHSSCEVAKQLDHDFNHCLVAALNWDISSSLAQQVVCGQAARERLEAKTTLDLDANNFFVNLLRRRGTLLLFFASNVHLKCVTFLAIKERLTNQWSCTGASETYVTPEGSKKCKLEKPGIKVKKADIEAGETFVKG